MKEVNTFWNKSDMLHIDAEWISNISLMIFISPYDSYGRQTVPEIYKHNFWPPKKSKH